MVEYLTITRGGALIWAFVIPGHKESLFSSFTNESHDEALSQVVSEEPKDFEIPDEFLASVMRVKPLCKKSYELQYCQSIIATIEGLRVSSLQGMLPQSPIVRHSPLIRSVQRGKPMPTCGERIATLTTTPFRHLFTRKTTRLSFLLSTCSCSIMSSVRFVRPARRSSNFPRGSR